MTIIGSSGNEKKRHLKRLPVKSFTVAPGDVIGGLIYVMDKPLGIEEGMVGMSIDSKGYREFVKETILQLDKDRKANLHPAPQLQAKYNDLIKDADFDFATLPPATQDVIIDLFLHHPNIKSYLESLDETQRKSVEDIRDNYFKINPKEPPHKKVSVPLRENLKKLVTKRMHEMTTTRYVNEGMGGLLLSAYKEQCKIKPTEHFASTIKKLIHGNKPQAVNNVYMVKQDGKLGAFHGTGPGISKILKTTTGKKRQENFTIPKIFTVVLPLISMGAVLGQRLWYLIKNNPASVNMDAIKETVATKLAVNRGCDAQEIETLKGTYEDGSPKVTTLVTWTPGLLDFSATNKLMGGENLEGLLVAQTAKGETIRVDKDGNLLHRKEIKDVDTVVGYEYYKNGIIVPESESKAIAKAYNEGVAISEDRIDGLGESLATLIAQGDRDAMGKKGQNKAYIPTGDGRFKFYGIDFGHAYANNPNPLMSSLSDDFSFVSPSGKNFFSNYSALYDNPLRDKMKGIYLLAALRGELTGVAKAKIIEEFETKEPKDLLFAKKLREMPGKKPEDLFKEEKDKYLAEINKVPPPSKRKIKEYQMYLAKLNEMEIIALKTDTKMLEVFSARYKLPPSQIDALERMEMLTAKKASITKQGKDVLIIRNHIHVAREDRIAWQFEGGQLTTRLAQGDVQGVQDKFKKMIDLLKQQKLALEQSNPTQAAKMQVLIEKLGSFTFKAGENKLPKLKEEELSTFTQSFSEENIAKVHDLKQYMSADKKRQFSKARDKVDAIVERKGQPQAPSQTVPAPESAPSSPLFTVVSAPKPALQVASPAVGPAQEPRTTAQPSISPSPQAGQDDTRKAPIAMRGRESVPPIPTLETLAETEVYSLQEFDQYTKKDAKTNEELEKQKTVYELHHIHEVKPIKMGNFQQHEGRVIFFEKPKGSENYSTAFVQTSAKGLSYSMPVAKDLEEFKRTALLVCHLAIFSATSNKPLSMAASMTPEKRAIMEDVFKETLKEAISAGKNPDVLPKLVQPKDSTRRKTGQSPTSG